MYVSFSFCYNILEYLTTVVLLFLCTTCSMSRTVCLILLLCGVQWAAGQQLLSDYCRTPESLATAYDGNIWFGVVRHRFNL